MSKGTGVNAAEKAMAHRFHQKARGDVVKNKTDLGSLSAAPTATSDGNLWDKSRFRQLVSPANQAPEAPVMNMGSRDPTIVRQGFQTNGLAGMGKIPDQDDQYYDNLAWYYNTYANIGGPNLGNKHGHDLGANFLDDRFFDYLERKKEKEFARRYEWFKLGMVDLKDPANRDYWQKKFPELVQKKMQFYKNREAIRARWNEICARGPDSREDLEFIYLYNLGMFDCSTIQEVSDYISNPQDRKIWLAAVNQGVIDWNKIDWNTDLKEPPSTPMDARDNKEFPPSSFPMDVNFGGRRIRLTSWNDMPKHFY